MGNKMNKVTVAILWSAIYTVLYGLLTVASCIVVPRGVLKLFGIVGGSYILINAFLVKYKRERLFVNGIISALAVLCLGVLVGSSLKVDEVIAIGVAISIVDVLSFTRYGKKTMNARAMSNVQFMSKLIVYGKGKNDTLIPTRGIGDYFYYAIWIAGIQSVSSSMLAYFGAVFMIFLGCCIDYIIILKLCQKENYKGFPATVFPFLCVFLLYLLCI